MKDKLKAERSEIQLLDGTCICEIDAVGQKWSDDEDMAQALVHRYNSHDALVEALGDIFNMTIAGTTCATVADLALKMKETAALALASVKEAK